MVTELLELLKLAYAFGVETWDYRRHGVGQFEPKGDEWNKHSHGMSRASEQLVARVYGLPLNDGRGIDVGRGTQVRWTEHVNGHLIVRRPNDDDHLLAGCVWVLVTGETLDELLVRGSIRSERVTDPKFVVPNDGRVTYWVPQSELLELEKGAEE